MSSISRRAFLKRSLAASVAGAAVLSMGKEALAATPATTPRGTLIDLSLCDGCAGEVAPRCVSACRQTNEPKFPKVKGTIHPYWPKTTNEDWSKKTNVIDRLTPYNWTYVQKVRVQHGGRQTELFVPRRCMHCDNPPCVSLCPYSAAV